MIRLLYKAKSRVCLKLLTCFKALWITSNSCNYWREAVCECTRAETIRRRRRANPKDACVGERVNSIADRRNLINFFTEDHTSSRHLKHLSNFYFNCFTHQISRISNNNHRPIRQITNTLSRFLA